MADLWRGQGVSTATVLTNRAEHITVINNSGEATRRKQEPYAAGPRGTRHMHETSLQLCAPTKEADLNAYKSTTSQSHSGKNDLPAPERQRPFPSQHTGHFAVVGGASMTEYHTKAQTDFPQRDLSQTASVFTQASELSRQQMAGEKMIASTQHTDDRVFTTQYQSVHSGSFASAQPHRPVQSTRNPITGE